jgi:hypothetical protein
MTQQHRTGPKTPYGLTDAGGNTRGVLHETPLSGNEACAPSTIIKRWEFWPWEH